jgi:hypothetical protein
MACCFCGFDGGSIRGKGVCFCDIRKNLETAYHAQIFSFIYPFFLFVTMVLFSSPSWDMKRWFLWTYFQHTCSHTRTHTYRSTREHEFSLVALETPISDDPFLKHVNVRSFVPFTGRRCPVSRAVGFGLRVPNENLCAGHPRHGINSLFKLINQNGHFFIKYSVRTWVHRSAFGSISVGVISSFFKKPSSSWPGT